MSLRDDLEEVLDGFHRVSRKLEEVLDKHLNGTPKANQLPPHIDRKLTASIEDAIGKKP